MAHTTQVCSSCSVSAVPPGYLQQTAWAGRVSAAPRRWPPSGSCRGRCTALRSSAGARPPGKRSLLRTWAELCTLRHPAGRGPAGAAWLYSPLSTGHCKPPFWAPSSVEICALVRKASVVRSDSYAGKATLSCSIIPLFLCFALRFTSAWCYCLCAYKYTSSVMVLIEYGFCGVGSVSEGQAGQFGEFGSCRRSHPTADAVPTQCSTTRLS